MNKINPDDPAFPIESNDLASVKLGLTIRQHYANSAPNEIPDWFVHVQSSDKPTMPGYDKEPELFQKEIQDWLRDPCYDLPEELQWFQKRVEQYNDNYSAWILQEKKQRYFQWRLFYADNLIAALNTKTE